VTWYALHRPDLERLGFSLSLFRDAEIARDAWNGINPDTLAPRGLQRLLEVAGPVPWALKAPLYKRLLPDPARHQAIFGSLLLSRFDVYGQIDEE
jgi:hypothetical protein